MSEGFVYRFPNRDFELGVGSRVPDVGGTLKEKGRMWTVVHVGRDANKRVVVHLEPSNRPTGEAETPKRSRRRVGPPALRAPQRSTPLGFETTLATSRQRTARLRLERQGCAQRPWMWSELLYEEEGERDR